MAGVDRSPLLAERSREGDGKRQADRDADPDPQVEGRRPTATELDLADPRLLDPDPLG